MIALSVLNPMKTAEVPQSAVLPLSVAQIAAHPDPNHFHTIHHLLSHPALILVACQWYLWLIP